MVSAISPSGGSVRERRSLEERFGSRMTVNPRLTRKTVSYQGNRLVPGLRWMKYKEGFSQKALYPFDRLHPLIAAGKGLI